MTKKPAPKRTNATLAQKIEVLDWFHANGKNQSQTARYFESCFPKLVIKQPLVSAWIRQTQHPEVTEMLELWVGKAMHDGILLTGEIIRQKWTRFADIVGIPQDDRLNLSDGWLTSFKTRNGLKEIRKHGEAGSVDIQSVGLERVRVQQLLEEVGYQAKDIFNMDETGMFYA